MSDPIALLVDGDNISAAQAPALLKEATGLGRLDIARAYFANPSSDWSAAPGFRPILAKGAKNATDIILSIDAMELALAQGLRHFVIATSDADFTHVALRLRETGRFVLGIGEAKAPPAFRAACSRFHQIAALPAAPKPVASPAAAPPPGATPPTASDLDRRIREVIGTHSKDGKGIRLTALSVEMGKLHGIKISTTPEKTWRAYLQARPTLFALDPKGPEAMVRFLPR